MVRVRVRVGLGLGLGRVGLTSSLTRRPLARLRLYELRQGKHTRVYLLSAFLRAKAGV